MTKNKSALLDAVLSRISSARGFHFTREDSNMVIENENLITTDQNKIAKELLGQTATTKDLSSIDAVLNYIKKLPNYEQLVAEARDTLIEEGVKVPEPQYIETFQPGSLGWMRQIIDICK